MRPTDIKPLAAGFLAVCELGPAKRGVRTKDNSVVTELTDEDRYEFRLLAA